MSRLGTTLALVLVLGAARAVPREAVASDWPVERFVTNLQARLREDPDDAAAHYTLGRVRAFAFALETSSLLGGEFAVGTWLKDHEDQFRVDSHESLLPPPSASELLVHLAEGVRHLRTACELEDVERHHLTLGWLLETGAHLADRVDTAALFELEARAADPEMQKRIKELGTVDESVAEAARRTLGSPENLPRAVPLLQLQTSSSNERRQKTVAALLRRFWIERSIEEYWRCFELAMQRELSEESILIEMGGRLESLVVHEALAAYRRLVQERGVQGPEEERKLAEAAAQWRLLEAKPRSTWITPMLVSLEHCAILPELVTPQLTVPFDLDGDGVDELWPWITPDAGWLVWDPQRRGEITSGRQLFGTASAWLFFEDGYRVLDALDDDRSGRVEGAELAGIAVWFDRDTDGVSDRGEVVPVEELGITALATEATLRIGASPANLCGLELADGRVLPTYDWVLAPVNP